MSGYNKATSDPRGLFNRFLPPTWRNTDSSNIVHNAIIKSIANTLVSAESDLLDSRAESYLETASGVFLDKWGSFSGVTRRTDETDDHYRARIKQWFTKKKGTVNSLIENIKEEFDDIDVYIYEPWRNIFYTNKSVLNGVDRLQGFYYRFAVIDIHISSTVDVKKLAKLVDRYKDAGVIVYFTYETGLSITTDVYDITMNTARFTDTSYDDSLVGRKQTLFPLGQPRNDITDADLFETNDSKISSKDVLSGNPLRGKVTYNSAGAAIVAKKYTTDMTMADAMIGIEEYGNTIYSDSRNPENTFYSKELLDAIFSSISFRFNPTFSYSYDTSNVNKSLKHYADVILNNTTFSYDSSTKTISRSTSQITSESPAINKMLNTVASKLNVYVDNIGDVRLATTYDNTLATKYKDFLKLYTLSIDPLTGVLKYTKNEDANLSVLSESDKEEIYRITGFELTRDGILAYATKDSDNQDIKAIVNSARLTINSDGLLVGNPPAIELSDNVKYMTDTATSDNMTGIAEYSNTIYGAANNEDGITYTIENAEETVYSKELLDAIFSSIIFRFNPTFSYSYDTSSVNKSLKYYVDTILNNTTFSYDSSTKTISRITAQVTSESPVVYNMLNTVASKLNVYVDNIGEVRLATTYDNTLATKYKDFLKLYTLSIDNLTWTLGYTKNTDAKLDALSESDKAEIYRITGFELAKDGILAYTTKDSDNQEIKAIVNSTKLEITSDGLLVGDIPTIDLADNTAYTIARDTFFIFDWLSFIKQNETDLFLDNSARYIRITTKGSQYGFNMHRVGITTETGIDVSDTAKWIKVGSDNVNLANGTIMSYPSVSTRSYTMDLGQVNKLATITLTDNYASNVKRVVEVSTDGVTYHKVGQVYSRGGDMVDVNSFNNMQAIGTWLSNHTISNELMYSLKDIITSTDISLYDFSNERWGNSILLPKGDVKGYVSVDSSRNVSNKGLSVVRITSTKTPYRLDMLKFKTGWL